MIFAQSGKMVDTSSAMILMRIDMMSQRLDMLNKRIDCMTMMPSQQIETVEEKHIEDEEASLAEKLIAILQAHTEQKTRKCEKKNEKKVQIMPKTTMLSDARRRSTIA
jgi:hypothetical protein